MIEKELVNIHDAEVVQVDMNKLNKRLILGFQTQKTELERLFLDDVAVFRINNFIKQNIVSRLITSLTQSISDEEVTHWVKWTNSLDSDVMIKPEAVQNYVNRIKNKELILLIIEPSWGAEIAVICRSFSFMDKSSKTCPT